MHVFRRLTENALLLGGRGAALFRLPRGFLPLGGESARLSFGVWSQDSGVTTARPRS
jgi:hypothetical protein